MKQVVTTAIVLNRLNFAEADRILTVLTPDQGKLRLMAKGVRKIKSKLAGGIELFSVSTITYIPGKRDISTLISTRLVSHFGNIVAEISRTQTAYELLKMIDKSTQDSCEAEYFELLLEGLQSLNEPNNQPVVIESWFRFRLLQLLGHEPNLITDTQNKKLEEGQRYLFDFDAMAFGVNDQGKFNSNHIKLLRLFLSQTPEKLMHIESIEKIADQINPTIKTMFSQFAHG